MNAVVTIMQAMDWKKYSLDEWLEQYGAWIESCRMTAGSLPDNLGVNQIWQFMRTAGVVKIPSAKITATCQITDDEARAIQRLIVDTMQGAESYFQLGLICLYKHKVENKGMRMVAEETNQSKSQVSIMVNIGRSYICGRHSYLKCGI